MKKFNINAPICALLLIPVSLYAQEDQAMDKKWNFGFHLGSDQYFASKPKPNTHNYKLENTYSYKAGIFAERNLMKKKLY